MTSAFGPGEAPVVGSGAAKPFMDGRKPLSIVIIGGSVAGLIAAIPLKRQGHSVRVLETAISSEREGLAAGVGLAAHVKRFFDEHDRLKDVPFATPNDYLEILEGDLRVKSRIPMFMNMTSWDATYYRLRANFDAYKSLYYPDPPPLDPGEGEGVFESGKTVVGVEEGSDDKLTIAVENGRTHSRETYTADLVIAADGANSAVRRQLLPHARREERGYVIWRGTVPMRELSQEFKDRFEGHTTLYPMPKQRSYSLMYTIPGENGSLAPAHREMNIAWYFWVPRAQIPHILTDRSGHTHRTTVPKGEMQPSVWTSQLRTAEQMFDPLLLELWQKMKNPFVSVVSSHGSPRAAFFSNRLFLIGDALAQKQPNTGQGTNLAAMDAMSLVDMINGLMTPEDWEALALERAAGERLRSVAFASWYLESWVGWAEIQVRYRWEYWRQWLVKWWYSGARVRARL